MVRVEGAVKKRSWDGIGAFVLLPTVFVAVSAPERRQYDVRQGIMEVHGILYIDFAVKIMTSWKVIMNVMTKLC